MATLTINTTGAQDARIIAAFGTYLDLGRNANADEVKQQVISFIRQIVHDQERLAAVAAITIDPIDPT